MSSANPSRRSALRALAILGASGLLAGCFTPLYGDPAVISGGRNAQAFLRDLDVPEIGGRSGVILRNELIYLTQGGGGRNTAAGHILRVNLRIESVPLVLNTAAGRPSAQNLTAIGDYTITPVGQTAPIYRGTASASASLDRTAQRLASDRAFIEAQERAAKVLAETIITDITGWSVARQR